jgi:hypothetical protein
MPGTGAQRTAARPRPRKFNFWHRLREIDLFFEGKDPVHKTMRRLVRRLERAGIPYALMGGMAVNAHQHRRTTDDLDILLTREGLEEFKRRFVPKNYARYPNRSRRFVDKTNQIEVDILVTGLFPGRGQPGPIAFPEPQAVSEVINKIRVINLITLVQLKLAARRYQDFADVVNLIARRNLDESFLQCLHPSVRRDFIECLEEKRREDEYLERNG